MISEVDLFMQEVEERDESTYHPESDVFTYDQKFIEQKDFKVLHLQNGLYRGQVKNEKQNGYGAMVYTDGSVFEGFWTSGEMMGVGYYRDATTGTVQRGVFLKDKIEGHGDETQKDGTIYSGTFLNGQY